MAIPTEKKCTRCNEVKPTDAFATNTSAGKKYLRGDCKACVAASFRARRANNLEWYEDHKKYQRDRRANDPEVREAQKQHKRDRYASDLEYRETHKAYQRYRRANATDYRERCRQRDQARLARTSSRVRRFHALLDHFAARPAWIDRIAAIVMKRPDAHGLQWLSSRIDDVCAHYCEA